LNLKNKEGVQIAKKLASNADILIEPFRKGVMERLGLGPNELLSSNPKLIYARLTGYGQYGELSARAGHDINYISYAGVLSTMGRAHDKPYAPINLVADFAGGGLMCAMAIMTALYERVSTHKGKVIDLAMVEGAAYLSSWLWTSRDIPGLWEGPRRGANLLDSGYAPYDTYETKDGKYVASGALEHNFYKQLLEGLGLNEQVEITPEVLAREFKKKTRDEWEEIFKNTDACVSPVLDLDEAPLNKHNVERKSFIKLDDNKMLPTMNWLNMSSDDATRTFRMPNVGEHSKLILSELGYSQAQIKQLIESNAVEQCEQSKSNL